MKNLAKLSSILLMLVQSAASHAAPGSRTAIVSGRLSYPADALPASLTVCTQVVGGRQTVCTTKHVKAKTGWRYSLALPGGTYHVYAVDPECAGWRAYYTAAVACGLSVKCTSHAPIEVAVREGTIRNDVDPADWYDVPASKKNACDL